MCICIMGGKVEKNHFLLIELCCVFFLFLHSFGERDIRVSSLDRVFHPAFAHVDHLFLAVTVYWSRSVLWYFFLQRSHVVCFGVSVFMEIFVTLKASCIRTSQVGHSVNIPELMSVLLLSVQPSRTAASASVLLLASKDGGSCLRC